MNTFAKPAAVVGTMLTSGSFNGVMVLGRDPEAGREFLRTAIAQGFTAFDTAPVYARGGAEEDIGSVVPRSATVWTKVGVDITTPLPQLDFTLDGMVRSLAGSLHRLGRDRVEAALVHNPTPRTLAGLDLEGFARHCAQTGQADRIGVSVLLPGESMPLIAGKLPPGSVVMCEADQLDPDDKATRELLEPYRLVVRSMFSGGARLREVPDDRRQQVIADRIAEITDRYAPEAVVIGARAVEHLVDYLPGPDWRS
ncbi:aldo/keto reductase [Micromonospora sp. NPDC049240]|uniref:aldo/keto reductase n=1 Tax=Micromonospora sp. NPDC049240 TaxID=3155151 RepID=UPI00340527A0